MKHVTIASIRNTSNLINEFYYSIIENWDSWISLLFFQNKWCNPTEPLGARQVFSFHYLYWKFVTEKQRL